MAKFRTVGSSNYGSVAVVGQASENEPVATIDPSIRRVLAATVSHSIIARIRCCARLTPPFSATSPPRPASC